MSIKRKYFHNATAALAFLDELACCRAETHIFRGHSDARYRLENTWQRDRKIPQEALKSDIDEALTKYKAGLQKLGLDSFSHEARLETLEHGRHHGVPTPCLDFSYSPYVALFFAFNGVRADDAGKRRKYSVIYALNVDRLAAHWASLRPHESTYEQAFKAFLYPDKSLFYYGYPTDHLQFIPLPGSKNPRMQRQLGAFVYDTLNYQKRQLKDLEEYLEKIEEPDISGQDAANREPTLYKIYINRSCAGNIFKRLELMNMTGGYLYGDAGGVAMDIRNAYHYKPKSFYLRDVDLPTNEEG